LKDQYVYILNGYDEKGNERLITFYTEEPLEENSFVKVRTDLNGYTDKPSEINIGYVPDVAMEKIEDYI